ILLDKGHIVAMGDPEEIADMHEADADKRRLQKRKAKQLMKHGVVDIGDVRKARRDGSLGEIYETNKEASAELTASKQTRKKRAKAEAAATKATEGSATEASSSRADGAKTEASTSESQGKAETTP
ncbi:MAG: hypothetical protein ACC726_16855, partial [Chloroflexota bacterium]